MILIGIAIGILIAYVVLRFKYTTVEERTIIDLANDNPVLFRKVQAAGFDGETYKVVLRTTTRFGKSKVKLIGESVIIDDYDYYIDNMCGLKHG